ncbi:hypothetical protein GDO86_012642 [Hymenochirus boettgeri]|uniref:Uncharacterized protein n=1 Tax=Hymenochirus boettgeri TaxID=247094 RepID=A0A8T2IRW6_9PIPI|nr:hypothetical protein GDO86_012642 [Hymenochirus boettgeri]
MIICVSNLTIFHSKFGKSHLSLNIMGSLITKGCLSPNILGHQTFNTLTRDLCILLRKQHSTYLTILVLWFLSKNKYYMGRF